MKKLTASLTAARLGLVLCGLALAWPGAVEATPAAAWPIPPGAQPAGRRGGAFACGVWTVTIPPGLVPDGGAVHCGPFDPNVAPPAPVGYRLLQDTINFNLYNNWGSWIAEYNYPNSPLLFCAPYGAAELAAAGNNPRNLVIQTAQIGGGWTPLVTSAYPDVQAVCATVYRQALFELSARTAEAPATGNQFYGAAPGAYVVQAGDSLFSIAQRFGTTVGALQAANGLWGNVIQAGQTLMIPDGTGQAGTPGAGAAGHAYPTDGIAPTPVPVWQAPAAAAAPAAFAPGAYTVQPGDNLFRIALNHGVSLDALLAANQLASNTIYPGEELTIP